MTGLTETSESDLEPKDSTLMVSADEVRELVNLGVVSWPDAARQLLSSRLGIELTDWTDFEFVRTTYPNMKAYTVTDPNVDGSSDIALCIDFSSDKFAEPLYFGFVNVHTRRTITLSVHMVNHLPALNSISDLTMCHRNFAPFKQLTRSVYLSAVSNRNGVGKDVNTGSMD